MVGRGDVPDGHGSQGPPGDWFLAIKSGILRRLGLVAKNWICGGFWGMDRRGRRPDLRVSCTLPLLGALPQGV